MNLGLILLPPILLLIFSVVAYNVYVFRNHIMIRQEGIHNSKLVNKLIGSIAPHPKSKEAKLLSNRLYRLSSDFTVNYFYMIKILTFVTMFIVGVAVVSTVVFDRRQAVFAPLTENASKDIVIHIDKPMYDKLSASLSFNEEEKEADLRLLGSAMATVDSELLNGYGKEEIYTKLVSLHEELADSFGFGDVIFVILFGVVSYMIPNMLLSAFTKSLISRTLFEFDSLETLIYLKVETPCKVDDLLSAMIDNSICFREHFRTFANIYETRPAFAYKMVLSRPEYPTKFVELIRYLYLLENSGEEIVIRRIETNQSMSEVKLNAYINQTVTKRKKILMAILFCCFIASAINSIIPILSTIDLSAFSTLNI